MPLLKERRSVHPDLGIFAGCVVLIVLFATMSQAFVSTTNLQPLAVSVSIIALLATGEALVIIVRGIDLSVGSILGMSAGLTLWPLMHGVPTAAALCIGVSSGLLVGIVNGFLIVKLSINDFIATLITLSVVGGCLEVLTSSVQLTGVRSGFFSSLAPGTIAGIPGALIIAVVIIAVGSLGMGKCKVGREIYAIGINPKAATLSGINVGRKRWWMYVLSGGLAGAAGVLMASRLNSVQPSLGNGYELTAIAAAVVGGVSLAGGRGHIWGAVGGAVFLGILQNGLEILGLNSLWFSIVIGVVIIAAVSLNHFAQVLGNRWLSLPKRRTNETVAKGEIA